VQHYDHGLDDQPGLRRLRSGKATVGVAYSSQLVVTGGTAPFKYSLVSGHCRRRHAEQRGRDLGKPTTAGTFTFTSKVVDAKGTRTPSNAPSW